MIQLWLGGKRIDSIPMLREEFALRDENVKIELCSELLKKIEEGVFIRWLDYFAETRQRANERERQQDESIGILLLDTCKDELVSGAAGGRLTEKARTALSDLCDIDLKSIEAAGRKSESHTSRDALFSRLEKLDWFQDDEVKRTLNRIPTDSLAVDTESLGFILENANTISGKHTDLYLLNVNGIPFTIRSLEKLHNVRLAGFGSPIVHFSTRLRGEELDMKAQNIIFDGFRLMPHGVIMKNTEDRMKNVEY